VDLEECEVCGEVWPVKWGCCPTCGDSDSPPLRMRDND
jgi:hypothetical protein